MWMSCLLALGLTVSALQPGPAPTGPAGDSGALPDLLLEARTAEHLRVAVGDTVWASSLGGPERAFTVSGIYCRPADPSTVTLRDYRVILHLPDLQRLLGAPDRVDRFSVRLRPGTDRRALIAEIDRIAYGVQAYPTERVADATSETFRVISRFHRALAGITIVGSGIFLLCLVVLKVEERRPDGATLRELGISRRTLFLWTFGEAVLMAALGTAVGLLAGWAGSGLINVYFRRVYDTTLAFARVTPSLGLRVTLIALFTGLGIGLWAGWRMVRTAPRRLREP